MTFIQMLLRIATGEDSAAFWQEFQKQAGSAFGEGVPGAKPKAP